MKDPYKFFIFGKFFSFCGIVQDPPRACIHDKDTEDAIQPSSRPTLS